MSTAVVLLVTFGGSCIATGAWRIYDTQRPGVVEYVQPVARAERLFRRKLGFAFVATGALSLVAALVLVMR